MGNLTVQDYLITRGLHIFGGFAGHPAISAMEAVRAGCDVSPAGLAACPLVETIRLGGSPLGGIDALYVLRPSPHVPPELIDSPETYEKVAAEYERGLIELAAAVVKVVLRHVTTGLGLDKLKLALEGAPRALVNALLRVGPCLPWCPRTIRGIVPDPIVMDKLQKDQQRVSMYATTRTTRADPHTWGVLQERYKQSIKRQTMFNWIAACDPSPPWQVLTWHPTDPTKVIQVNLPGVFARAMGITDAGEFSDAMRVSAAFWVCGYDSGAVLAPKLTEHTAPPFDDIRIAIRARHFDSMFSTDHRGEIVPVLSAKVRSTDAFKNPTAVLPADAPPWLVWRNAHYRTELAWTGLDGMLYRDAMDASQRATLLNAVSHPGSKKHLFPDPPKSAPAGAVTIEHVLHLYGWEVPKAEAADAPPAPTVEAPAEPESPFEHDDTQEGRVEQQEEGEEDIDVPAPPRTTGRSAPRKGEEDGAIVVSPNGVRIYPEASFPFLDFAEPAAFGTAHAPELDQGLPLATRVVRHPALHTFCTTLGYRADELARVTRNKITIHRAGSGQVIRGGQQSVDILRALNAHALIRYNRERDESDWFIGFHAPLPGGSIVHAGVVYRYHLGADEFTEHPIVWISDREGKPSDYAYDPEGKPYFPVEDTPFEFSGGTQWWAEAISLLLGRYELNTNLREPGRPPGARAGVAMVLYYAYQTALRAAREAGEATLRYFSIVYRIPGHQDLHVVSSLDGGAVLAHVDNGGVVDLALYGADWSAASRKVFFTVGREPQVVPAPDAALFSTWSSNLLSQGWVALAEAGAQHLTFDLEVNTPTVRGMVSVASHKQPRRAPPPAAEPRAPSAREGRKPAGESVATRVNRWTIQVSDRMRDDLDGQLRAGLPH